ncbi:hypothetical protein TNCV_2827181 [Trichonephila clavipes]|nr:hypothetical protein TNCV_2827181 [Trichonephila clavipes]
MTPEPQRPHHTNRRTLELSTDLACIAALHGRPSGLVTLTAVPLGLGSNPREDVDVRKYIVPSWQGGILTNSRTTSTPVKLMKGEEVCEAPAPSHGVPFQTWGRI